MEQLHTNEAKATEFGNGVHKASRDITQNSDNIGVTHNQPAPLLLAAGGSPSIPSFSSVDEGL